MLSEQIKKREKVRDEDQHDAEALREECQKGNAKYDPRVSFVSNLIWELPVGREKWLLNNDGIASRIIVGSKVSGA